MTSFYLSRSLLIPHWCRNSGNLQGACYIWRHSLKGCAPCLWRVHMYLQSRHLLFEVMFISWESPTSGADPAFFVGGGRNSKLGVFNVVRGFARNSMNCFQSWGHFSAGAGAKAPWPPPLDPPLNLYTNCHWIKVKSYEVALTLTVWQVTRIRETTQVDLAAVLMRLPKGGGGPSSLLPAYFCPFSLLPNEVSSPCSLLNFSHSPCSLLIFVHSPCSLITP